LRRIDQAALPVAVEPLGLEPRSRAVADLFTEGAVLPGARLGDDEGDVEGEVEWAELSRAELENALWEGGWRPAWLYCFLLAVGLAMIVTAIAQ
jgi:hypothetical protein